MFSCFYEGKVFHKRYKPKVHQLKYRVCSFLFDLDELKTMNDDLRFFSHNKWNLVSFWDKDHGRGDGGDLRAYVEDILEQADQPVDGGAIRLLCYPRLFGYVFNPLSVYYCYDRDDHLHTIIYEVSNTFGQRHSYVIATEGKSDAVIRQKCRKGFYVSPFMEMDCDYAFRMVPPSEHINVSITQSDREGTILTAYFKGERQRVTDRGLLSMLTRYPLMTLKVVAGIHWEAFHLWRKGMKLVKRPQAPVNPITVVPSRQMEIKS